MTWHFPIRYFLECCSKRVQNTSIPEPSLCPCNSLFILIIHSAFLLCFFRFFSSLQNCSASFAPGCWFILVHLPPTWQNFLSFFFFFFGRCYFVCPDIFWVSLLSSISLIDLFSLFIQIYPLCFSFLSILICNYSFFICPPSQISYQYLVFSSCFLKGTLILSLSSFAPAGFGSFSSVSGYCTI